MDKIILEKIKCPLCGAKPVKFDIQEEKYQCNECQFEWSDIYVLVKYPVDSCYFEQKNIGYPCFNSEDNGACYIPEYNYIQHYGKHPPKEKYFLPVPWPESQEYMDNPECEAIMADEKGLEDFGSSAYWVPLRLTQHNHNS